MSGDAYKKAGVDIEAADRMIDRIKPLAAATHRAGVMGGLGGFGGLFDLQNRYKHPILVSGTDGVGTKLLVAQQVGIHNTIGIDLVAMCVNDIAVLGAEPLFFLDYFATGHLEPSIGEQVIAGIAEGCKQAGCALLGGETAEMPGMYAPGHYDLAGFAVGAVEKSKMIDGSLVQPGNIIIGIPASGLHSNGYSLVRKVLFEDAQLPFDHTPAGWEKTLAEVLMTPTRIYIPEMQALMKTTGFHAAAHITGGGIPGNVIRVLPENCRAIIDGSTWEFPPVFKLLQKTGGLSTDDMLNTFNCGIGMMLVVNEQHVKETCQAVGGFPIGHIEAGTREVVVQ
jgi:phosphoribosylformylglycinamidine cyclo-ligase